MEDKKRNSGGLWLKTSKSGNKFMSGSIEIQGKKHQFVVFKNLHKNGETHPDYVIFPSTPLPAAEQKKPVNPDAEVDDINNEEIPF